MNESKWMIFLRSQLMEDQPHLEMINHALVLLFSQSICFFGAFDQIIIFFEKYSNQID